MIRNLRPLAVVGGVALDITGTIQPSSRSVLNTSTPGKVKQSLGGVGRNVCEAAMRTGAPSIMVSTTGQDLAGTTIREGMRLIGMDTKYITTCSTHSTAVYNALHSGDGQLVAAVADMDIFDSLESSTASQWQNRLNIIDIHIFFQVRASLEDIQPGLVCMDGNISSDLMRTIGLYCKQANVPLFFEPTSVPKALKVFEHQIISSGAVHYVSPNQYELEAMVDTARKLFPAVEHSKIMIKKTPDIVSRVLPMAHYLSHFVPNIITKLGEYGCLLVTNNQSHLHSQYFPPETIEPSAIKSVTGAGDCFVGTLLANLLLLGTANKANWTDMIQQSQRASILTLQSDLAVSTAINQTLLVKTA
ncbi:Ribokinase-like protein [Phycomyces nitens]|nr:Ribokinase-like protein [Phycomyces nitens]